ncbi:hypothetical protein DRW03_19960 [Corallococcus sp. H22C18031201]|uniref:hypothetical protein n=1 Tax=Citreicoccus inhibens TaxID=2849499 RepID=UPI000E75D202|nr:hypothetical protein [Citreicoccus inhibens]MBU8895610.1 hypothetical protein [Citreicoccus inhibens]RJS20047.1 hypothetical protein DRW03_19960 [Corallococcus sp. H22C18031201]
MKNFGPFNSYADALNAACPLILSKPNATVVHLQDSSPDVARRAATEYCAWLYYTPSELYEMSMLADQSGPGDFVSGMRSCSLPPFVDDPRYSAEQLKHIFALHNHPFGTRLSANDLRFIESMAEVHDWEVMTRNGKVRLSIIAFFSKSQDPAAPTCDGFYQYVPATREMMLWTRQNGQWKLDVHGIVTWINERTYRLEPQ